MVSGFFVKTVAKTDIATINHKLKTINYKQICIWNK
jgi:hypothetical protein